MPAPLGRRRFLAVTAAAGAFAGRARAQPAPLYVWEGTALGARASLRLSHPDRGAAQALIARCLLEIERLERAFSLYRPDSALVRLNRDGALDAPPFDLLRVLTDARASTG